MKVKNTVWISVFSVSLLLTVGAALASDEGEKHGKQEKMDIHEYIKGASLQNGSYLYYYGVNLWGQRVPIAGGPPFLYMHGGGCVQCHGPNGQGGIVPMMCNVMAPAITYQALTGEAHEHEDKKATSSEEEHEAYTIQTIRIAIEQGIDPAGEPLNWCMPRWGLSSIDFRDLLAYLVYLGEGQKNH